MRRIQLLIAIVIATVTMSVLQAQEFQKLVLNDKYLCDGVTTSDINGDGHIDIVAGPYWHEGPDFQVAHAFYKPIPLPPADSPSNSMFSFVYDFSGDGKPDILVLGRVHKHEALWYENPGDSDELWQSHFAFQRVKGESPTLVDLDGDGVPQVICHWEGKWGSIQPDPEQPKAAWKFKPVTDEVEDWPQFYHGQGVGDINGDGRLDLILNDGWLEQPSGRKDTERQKTSADETMRVWQFHRKRFSDLRGGAQMFAYDVDGDGDSDVISAKHAHEWGLAWYEQLRDADANVHFREHLIMGDRSQEKEFGIAFSQPHAMTLADIDGDGLTDIVTGKRRWAHGPTGDIEPNADPIVCWFRLNRTPDGVKYTPHIIDRNSGVGVQIQATDVNADGRVDVLTTSKLGTFLFLNQP